MTPYICLNLMLILLWLNNSRWNKKRNGCLYIEKKRVVSLKHLQIAFAILVIALFMGLRGSFTTDYKNYCELFSITIKRSFKDVLSGGAYEERGYLLLNKLFGLISNNANMFMLFEALLFVFVIYAAAKKQTQDIFLFSIMFVNAGIYLHAFNLTRQALAAAIIYYAIQMLIEKKTWKYVFFIILASLIHATSLVMLVALPFLIQDINVKNTLKMAVLLLVGLLLLKRIIGLVQMYRYTGYSYGMGAGTANAYVVQWAITVYTWIMIKRGALDIRQRKYKILMNCSIFYVMCSVAALEVYQMSRLCYFFSTPMLLLSCNVLEKLKGESGFWTEMILVLMLAAYMFVWISGTPYVPYHTFL